MSGEILSGLVGGVLAPYIWKNPWSIQALEGIRSLPSLDLSSNFIDWYTLRRA